MPNGKRSARAARVRSYVDAGVSPRQGAAASWVVREASVTARGAQVVTNVRAADPRRGVPHMVWQDRVTTRVPEWGVCSCELTRKCTCRTDPFHVHA